MREILAALRTGEAPAPEAMAWVAEALASGEMSDAQAGAFAMGVCRAPLPAPARVALTEGMRDSGDVLAWELPGPVLDKHSTGGIGDCVSLVLAPALAACGAFVPMISGRGLGHTGGTLDKLEAIPGFAVDLSEARLRRVVAEVGCAIAGATERIAPADRRLYAVRDLTGTVESLDLIVASILSKKLAAGLDGLVLDVKVGSGAFMKDMAAARALASALVETARGAGCSAAALITDMDQPLAPAAGNAVEVASAMAALTGEAGALAGLVAALGGTVLALGGLAADAEAGAAQVSRAVTEGRAAEVFGRMVAAQGGPADFIETWRTVLPAAPVVLDVMPKTAGQVARIDAAALGRIVVALGGGRRQAGARIDPSVGLSAIARIGAEVGPGQPLARVHAADREAGAAAMAQVRDAFGLGAASALPLVRERVL